MKQELINAILGSYYWLFFSGLTVAIFSPIKLEKRSQNYFWFLLFLFFSIFIGFRHEVGGDWLHYLWSFSHINDEFHPLKFSSLKDNYGYNLVAWFFYNIGGNIYLVNFVNALIFMLGLTLYALRQNQSLLVFLIAFPYLIIVVATGYTRQATAIGFIFLGINALTDRKIRLFLLYLFLATFFHYTAICMVILLLALSKTRIKFFIYIILIIVLLSISLFLFKDVLNHLIYYYTGEGMYFDSKGALPRYVFHIIAALLCIFFRNNLSDNKIEKNIYLLMSVVIIMGIFFVNAYSSAIDRLLIYFMPLQLFAFSRLHILTKLTRYRNLYNVVIVGSCAMMLTGILYLAQHRGMWINYEIKFMDNKDLILTEPPPKGIPPKK